MQIRYDLFLNRQSLMHSSTFVNVYETYDVSKKERIWPRLHVLSLVCRVPFLASQVSHITPTLSSIAGRSSPLLPSFTLLFLLILPSFAPLVDGGFSCTNYPGGAQHSSRPPPDPDRARVAVRLTFDDPDATKQSILLAMTLFP